MADEEIKDLEDEGKVTIAGYLRDKFGGEAPDSEISNYLNEKFDTHDLPGGQKKRMTIPEMLKAAQDNRDSINAICIVPKTK